MEKENLIDLANSFWEESILANSYYEIIKQYRNNYNKYLEEMRYSSAFYTIAYQAICNSLFMQLAKIYDKSKNTINIGFLLEKCSDNIKIFLEYKKIEQIETDGQNENLDISFEHQIKPTEECYFKEYIEKERKFQKMFGVDKIDLPIKINLTIPQYINLYKKRYYALNPKINSFTIQRNKIYAHNDKNLCFNIDEILKKNPIFYNDIQELIDYALDVSRFVIECLDGINIPEQYVNINDWESTLKLVQLGSKYQDIEVESQTKEFIEKVFPNNLSN